MAKLHHPSEYRELETEVLLAERKRLLDFAAMADIITLEPFRREYQRQGPDFAALLPSYYVNRLIGTAALVERANLLTEIIDDELARREAP